MKFSIKNFCASRLCDLLLRHRRCVCNREVSGNMPRNRVGGDSLEARRSVETLKAVIDYNDYDFTDLDDYADD